MSLLHCPHGSTACGGRPSNGPGDPGTPPCRPGEYVYCPHGVDSRWATTEGAVRCPFAAA